MDIVNDVIPVSEFKKDLPNILKKIRSKKSPVLITQNGKSSGILLDVEVYQHDLRKMKVIEGILKGEKDISRGNIFSHFEVERKFKI